MTKKSLYLILAPLSLWVLNEIFIFQPNFFFVSLSLGLMVITFSVRGIMKENRSKFWPVFMLPPALFYLSLSFYSGILVSQFWIQAIFVLNVWFVFSYFRNLYHHFNFPTPESEAKLRRLLKSGSFLSTFALAATLYGLPIFLSWNFSFLLLPFIAASFIIFGQFLIFAKDIDREQIIFFIINVLVLAEFTGVLFFLPLNYNTLGLLVALVFYLLIIFNDWRFENRLNFKNIKWPLIILLVITILVLLSARWL
jgi:hypothetical protein